MKKYLIVLLVIIVAVVTFLVLGNNNDTETKKVEKAEILVVLPQEVGGSVNISRAVLYSPGFVILREVIDGKPGQIVEISDYMTSGIVQNIVINISAVELTEGSELVAVLYKDNGDTGFNPSTDVVVYEKGAPLARYIKTGEPAPASAVIAGAGNNANAPIAVTVEYTDKGFSPSIVEISKGETVLFVNKSSVSMWVASNPHPAHTILPTFDQFGMALRDETYQYTFDEAGEWNYHDHINASQLGTIIVR